jgi:hypothetical protein
MTRCALDRADDRALDRADARDDARDDAADPAARCRMAYRHHGLPSDTADACRALAPFGPPVSVPGWTLRRRGRIR